MKNESAPNLLCRAKSVVNLVAWDAGKATLEPVDELVNIRYVFYTLEASAVTRRHAVRIYVYPSDSLRSTTQSMLHF